MTEPKTFLTRLRPPPAGQRIAAEDHPIFRAAFASFLAKTSVGQGQHPETLALDIWRDARAARIIQRGDVALETSDGSLLVGSRVSDFIASLPIGAASKLIAAGLQLDLGDAASLSIPRRTGGPVTRPWVAEGDPIPVTTATFAGVTLGPLHKIAVMGVFSHELAKQARAEAAFRTILTEDAARSLDVAVFSTDAGTDDSCAGLLFGVTESAADATDIASGLATLAADVAAGGGSGRVALVVNPREAAILAVRHPQLAWPVWPSMVVPAGRVIALDPGAFVTASDNRIDVSASRTGILHMSDEPLPVVDGSGVTADPVRALWQTACVSVRLMIDLDFTMRTPAIAYVDGVSW